MLWGAVVGKAFGAVIDTVGSEHELEMTDGATWEASVVAGVSGWEHCRKKL